jgi:hypothetical protein
MSREEIHFFLPGYTFGFKNEKHILNFILFIAIVLRTGICFFSGMANLHIDTVDYFKQADAIIAGSFINYFPNGYPFLIALLKSTGIEWLKPALLWMNIFMGAGTVYFVYGIARSFSSNTLAPLLAAFLIAIFPSQVNYARWLLSEVPAVFFLTGFYFFYLQQKNITSGLMMAAAVIIRTELLPVLLFVVILEWLYQRRIRWSIIASFLLPVLITAFYCYSKTGAFAIAGHSKVNIMYSVTAAGGYIDWHFMDKHPEIQTAAEARNFYIQYAWEQPYEFLKNKFANLWELWGFFPSSSGGNRGLGSRLLIGACNFFLLSFGLAGWWLNRKRFIATCLLLPFIIVTIVHTLLLAFPRYTFAAEPYMLIFAADRLSAFMLKKSN